MQLARDEFEQGLNAWLNSGGKLNKDDASTTLRQVDPADWQAQREVCGWHDRAYAGQLTHHPLLALHRTPLPSTSQQGRDRAA